MNPLTLKSSPRSAACTAAAFAFFGLASSRVTAQAAGEAVADTTAEFSPRETNSAPARAQGRAREIARQLSTSLRPEALPPGSAASGSAGRSVSVAGALAATRLDGARAPAAAGRVPPLSIGAAQARRDAGLAAARARLSVGVGVFSGALAAFWKLVRW